MRTSKFLLLPFITIIAVCVFAVSYFSYQDGKDIITQSTERYYRFVLLEVSQSIRKRVDKILEVAKITAEIGPVKQFLTAGNDDTFNRNHDATLSKSLEYINKINTESSAIAIVDPQGKVLANSGILAPLPLPQILTEVASHIKAQKSYVGVYLHPQSRQSIIWGITPIVQNAQLLGAVIIEMNMATFPQVWSLPLFSLSEVHLSLLNAKHMVITCSDKHVQDGKAYATNAYTRDLLRSTGTLQELDEQGLRMGMREMLPDSEWSVTISVEKNVLLAPATNLLRNTAITSTLSGLLAIFGLCFVFKKMQASVRKSDDTVAQIIDAASLPTWEWKENSPDLRVNRHFNQLLGYAESNSLYPVIWCRENIRPQPLDPAEDADSAKIPQQPTAQSIGNYTCEYTVRNSAGQWQWLRAIGTVSARHADGSIKTGRGIFIDIAMQKQREEEKNRQHEWLEHLVEERTHALQESNNIIRHERAILDSVLHNIPDVIYYKDIQRRYVGCNAAFLHACNMEASQVIGKVDAEIGYMDEESLAITHEADMQALQHPGPYWHEHTVVLHGKTQINETVKNAYRDKDGTILGIVGISRDITARKAAEAELVRTRHEAHAASQAKSEFLANMSHEIRTPLNGIVGLNYLAMQENPPEKVQQYLKKIESSARNLALIINDILDFSKIEAGKLELETSPFAMRDIVHSTLDMIRPEADNKGIALHVLHLDCVPEVLVGDALRLSQVLLNLLSNALKFTHKGSITLKFDHKDTRENTVCLEISVEDSGIGMTAEHLARLFTAFTQADSSTTRKYGGTGLGLTISKSFIEMMGGSLSVSSLPDKGSCFFFTVWLALPDSGVNQTRLDTDLMLQPGKNSREQSRTDTVQPCVPAHDETSSGSMAQQPISLKGLHILLAEDNEINQIIAREILESVGCVVDIAADGQEAVHMALHNAYAVILMDIQMPVMDGFTATALLRQNPVLDNTPIIAMTAHALVSDKEKSLAAGMQDHVTKPIDPRYFCEKVQHWAQSTDAYKNG